MIKLFLILTLAIQSAFAEDCAKNVEFLKKGDTASCSGYLFSPEQEQKVRIQVQAYNELEKFIEKQEQLNNILSKRLINSQEYNEYLSDRLKKSKDSSILLNTLYFSLGAVITGIIASNVRR